MEGVVSQFAGSYREWAPQASLRGHVRCLWINDLSGSRSESLRVVPDGCVDIVWDGEALCIAGPDTRPILARMPSGAIVVGARFHPGAASPWLGQPLDEIANARVPLAELWGTMQHASSTEPQKVAVRNNWPMTSKPFSSADWPPSGPPTGTSRSCDGPQATTASPRDSGSIS